MFWKQIILFYFFFFYADIVIIVMQSRKFQNGRTYCDGVSWTKYGEQRRETRSPHLWNDDISQSFREPVDLNGVVQLK